MRTSTQIVSLLIDRFGFKFLNRTLNEYIVESEVSSIEVVNIKKRNLKDDDVAKLNFISTNGPHPLMSAILVEDFLTNCFGSNWHFTIAKSKWFVSKTVGKQLETARSANKTLA